MDRNDYKNAFRNITNFIKSVSNTDIVLTNVPIRYDLCESSEVNNKIKTFNKKLLKLAKIFSHVSIIETDTSRLLFTKLGMHLNKADKELLSNQLVLHIFAMLKEISVIPISLGRYDKPQANVSLKASQVITSKNGQLAIEQELKCVRKVPVTRKDDFLWEV
jgi:cell fate (sporulation/competence/biofilm development) regulator YmcA (YheA/YmcA/DUF963 family)